MIIMKKIISIWLTCIFIFSNILISNVFTKANEDNNETNLVNTISRKNWTWMFYDDADFGEGHSDVIYQFAEEAYSSDNINVIVLQDSRFDSAKIWYIDENHNMSLLEELSELNMGDYATLKDFINYSKVNFPADRYFLSVYNHGMAWEGACIDDTNNDTLIMDEFQKALSEEDGVDIICSITFAIIFPALGSFHCFGVDPISMNIVGFSR